MRQHGRCFATVTYALLAGAVRIEWIETVLANSILSQEDLT